MEYGSTDKRNSDDFRHWKHNIGRNSLYDISIQLLRLGESIWLMTLSKIDTIA
jgi:hypothetical protein